MKTPPKGKIEQVIEGAEPKIIAAAEAAGDALGRVVQAAEAAMESPTYKKGKESAINIGKQVVAMAKKAGARAKTAAAARRARPAPGAKRKAAPKKKAGAKK